MSEGIKQSVSNLFKGVRLNQIVINEVEVDDTATSGALSVSLYAEHHQIMTTLQFPARWHEHELVVNGEGMGAIRWCKKCNYSSVLSQGANDTPEWLEIKESSK